MRAFQNGGGEHRYYVTCHPGLEEVVATELLSPHIRATGVQPGRAGVSFVGDASTGYRANLWLRSAIRVLQLLGVAELDPRRPGGDEVYRAMMEALPWTDLLQPNQSFAVEARVRSCTNLTSSQLLVVRTKDAICDYIRDRRGAKPQPPEPGRTADLPLYCTAFQDRLTLYRDQGGVSLHRRGYRRAMHRASLNESAAAGILYLAGWDKLCMEGDGAVLADPMCGSGTFLIEAALMASRTAPGLFRGWWPLQSWPDFDRGAWQQAVQEAIDARRAPLPGVALLGNDVHAGALGLALRDAESARVKPVVTLHQGGCREWWLLAAPRLVVSNPPWGQRLMGLEEAAAEAGGGTRNSSSSDWQGSGYGEGRVAGAQLAEGLEDWWDDIARPSKEPPAGAGAGFAHRQFQQGGGVNSSGAEGLAAAWHDLSVFLKEQCGGAEACLLSGSSDATQHLRLRADKKWPLTIGGVDCRLLKYSIRGRVPAPMPAPPLPTGRGQTL
ncbi:hypothetical protein N2152v2_010409 [Parachlorella kessleri]